ncbi:MAG: tyrosine-type recombinase/integrase [Terracidiphilus sp.]
MRQVVERSEARAVIEPAHSVSAAFTPKFTFSGKAVVDYNVAGFDSTRHVNSWRTAWQTWTKAAGLPGFRFHDLRHCAITSLAESGASDSTIMAIAGDLSRRMLERYLTLPSECVSLNGPGFEETYSSSS